MTGLRRSATLLVVLAAVGTTVATAGPALAEERVVQIGRDGVRPKVLRVEPGDTVRFVNEDPTFAYRAQSDGGPWRFDSGPTALLEGDFAVPSPLTRPGTYAYRVAQDAPFRGQVVVAGAVPVSAAPVSPAPSTPSAAATLVPVPTPVPTPVPSGLPSSSAAAAVEGPLAGPPSSRDLGLAVTVATVLLLGTGSLLLRLLLAFPVLSDRPARL